MKTVIFIYLLSCTLLTTFSVSQPSKITIFQNTDRQIESFKKVKINSSEKQVYMQFVQDYTTSSNYSGAIIKYNKLLNNWNNDPFNSFLATHCSIKPPSQICRSIIFFMTAPSDTNYVLSYRQSSWSVDPDARTFLSTNAGLNFSMYGQFACGGTMLLPCGGDINGDNSVWYYSYPVLFNNENQYIYKSTDRGESWSVISEVENMRVAVPHSSFLLAGGFLKINPFNENHIFISSKDHTMLSVNGGVNFSSLNIPPAKEIVFDYSDNSIYSIAGNKIYKSLDNGLMWDSSSVPFVFNTLEISPDDNNIMYAGSPHGVYRTTDRGVNWYLYNNTFNITRNVIGISKDSNTGDTIIVCTNNEVYKVFRGEQVGILPYPGNVNEFELHQNYPNPFNPVTKLRFGISNSGYVTLRVYDIRGNEAATLVNENLNAGAYSLEFDGSNFPSGIYYYKLTSGNFSEVRKMMLIK